MAEELKLSIGKLVYGGDGLAHADGNTVFVPYVLPGEEVRAASKSRKKKLIWAELVEVSSPAKERGKAKCPHFQKCGGCHYQHIPAAEQLRLKKEILRETLARLGGVWWEGGIEERSAGPYGYGNRAQWAVRSGMPRALGYFLPESSTILPIDECPVLSPRISETFTQLQNMARSGTLSAGIREIEAFADSADEKIALNVAFEKFPKPAAELASVFREALPQIESLLLLDQKKNRFELTGPGYLTHEAGGYEFRGSHPSVCQANRFRSENLKKLVTRNAHAELALARDVAVVTGSARKPKEITGASIRYEITEMHLFDLFPQTFHIETFVRLRRVP